MGFDRKPRILWVSNSPLSRASYGMVTRYLTKYLTSDFEVIGAAIDEAGSLPFDYNGIKWYYTGLNFSIIEKLFFAKDCDLAIVFREAWLFNGIEKAKIPFISYFPLSQPEPPLGFHEKVWYALEIWSPCRHEAEVIAREGFKTRYVPHGVDTTIFRPMDNRLELKRKFGFNRFDIVIGIVAVNQLRKVIPWQLEAVKIFMDRHKDLRIGVALHTTPVPIHEPYDGYNLAYVVKKLGLEGKVLWTTELKYTHGLTDEEMAEIYNALDVLLEVSYESFGLPIIEAQACGTPVVTLGYGGGAEINLLGFTVKNVYVSYGVNGTPHLIPDPYEIVDKLEQAVKVGLDNNERLKLAEKAKAFDWLNIYVQYVKPAIEELLNEYWYEYKSPTSNYKTAIVSSWKVRCGIAYYTENMIKRMKDINVKVFPIPAFREIDEGYIRWLINRIKQYKPNEVLVQVEPGLLEVKSWELLFGHLALIKTQLGFKIKCIEHCTACLPLFDISLASVCDEIEFINPLLEPIIRQLFELFGIEHKAIRFTELSFHIDESIKRKSKEEIRRRLGLDLHKPVICLAGFINERKGIREFMSVIKNLVDRIGNGKVQFLIIGGPQFPREVELYKAICNDKFEKDYNVKCTNFIYQHEEFMENLLACDVIIYLGKGLGQSGVVQLAHQLGITTIAIKSPMILRKANLIFTNIDELVNHLVERYKSNLIK